MFGDEVVTEAAQLDSMMKSGGVRKYIGCSEAMLHQKFPVQLFLFSVYGCKNFHCISSEQVTVVSVAVIHLMTLESE